MTKNRMMIKKIVCIAAAITVCAFTASAQSALDSRSFLEHVEVHAHEFIGSEFSRQQYEASYLQSRALLYPQVTAILPGSWNNQLTETVYSATVPGGIIVTEDQIAYGISPQLRLSQLLPGAGTLSASVKNTMSFMDSGTVVKPFTVAGTESNSNTFDLSLELSQPVYFKNAYKAAVELVESSRQVNLLGWEQNKAALYVQALQDFYSISQLAYQRELVERRLAADRASFQRIEKEGELGLWTKTVTLTARLSLTRSEIDFQRVDSSYKETLDRFAKLYGFAELPLILPAVETVVVDQTMLDQAEALVLSGNPSLMRLEHSIRMLESNAIIFEKDNAPVLSAGISRSDLSMTEGKGREGVSVNASVSLTARLADGGAFKAGKASRQSEIASSRQLAIATRERTLSQARTLRDTIALSKRNGEYYAMLVESASYELDRGIKDKELGYITDKQLIELKLDLENARLALQLNTIERNSSYLQLLALMGKDARTVTFGPPSNPELKGSENE